MYVFFLILPSGDGFGAGGDGGREEEPREFVADRLTFEGQAELFDETEEGGAVVGAPERKHLNA